MKSLRDRLSGFVSFLVRRKPFVDINPRYNLFLKSQRLTAPEHFLSLPAIIVSGHPDRHVARVILGAGPDSFSAFLKKEHRVPWRDRLANALAGFGFCSKSRREGVMLRVLRQCGIGGPEFVAAGEDSHGRAFLVVRESEGGVDLRRFLADRGRTLCQRLRIVKELGAMLARIHNAGLEHRDLYSKHILVDTRGTEINILDWQRSRRRSDVAWGQRWRDLAALDATLAEGLANARLRLTGLRAYLESSSGQPVSRTSFLQAARAIRHQSQRLLRRRKIREMRQPPLAEASQQLVWLQGEELCVTQEFLAATGGRMPELLSSLITSRIGPRLGKVEELVIPRVGTTTLVRGRRSHPFRWLWSWITRRRIFSSEQQKASIIFRLERHSVRTPRLFAFGQRLGPWRIESFLLTKNLDDTVPLFDWLCHRLGKITETNQCWAMLREAGTLFRRMHEAQCYFPGARRIPIEIEAIPGGGPSVVLTALDGLCKRHRPSRALAMKDLNTFFRGLAPANLNRSDHLRFLLAYLGERRLTTASKRLIRRLCLRWSGGGSQRSVGRVFEAHQLAVDGFLPVDSAHPTAASSPLTVDS
jgi:tRNA A-37 threonylcarbamoyl transferase component Bud32